MRDRRDGQYLGEQCRSTVPAWRSATGGVAGQDPYTAFGYANPTWRVLAGVLLTRARIEAHDDLVDALCDSFGRLTVGDPFDPASEIGPVISARQRARIEGYLATGREPARLAIGGGRPAHLDRGFCVEPTVFADVDNRSVIAQEETVGPVLSVIPADGAAGAIAKANDTVYGLNASVFTHDVDRVRGHPAAEVGHCGPHGVRADGSITFGGFRQSGIGREGESRACVPTWKARHCCWTSCGKDTVDCRSIR